MWLGLGFLSASLLGLYDFTKKQALKDNAVLPVLWFNTLFSTLLFMPMIIDSELQLGWLEGSIFSSTQGDLKAHFLVVMKSAIVLTSWLFGYYGLKHLPLTIVGPINATRPVLVLLGAMLLFGERLNAMQWVGVLLSFLSIMLLSRAGRKEGIRFTHNRWILLIALSAITGAMSGLYDRYIMFSLNPIFVQSWYNVYQLIMMSIICAIIWWPKRKENTPFHWSWAIPMISIFLSMADFAYLYALSDDDAMISIVSMVRRSSVIIAFICGAFILHEKNLKAKLFDLCLILLGMI
ncbi:MAG: DMT family transporter, partial [Alistipes sp.]|nr:DMT family transporter [Alistipes sp.]